MINNLYGNPHSASDPARLSGEIVDSIRAKALQFFNADPDHFDLLFVANATAAIKLVGESFRDLTAAGSIPGAFWYGYHKDAHTSVVGVREYAEGNYHCFGSDQEVEEWLNGYSARINTLNDGSLPGLFAYPGQSNMTGRRLPLSWTGMLRQSTRTPHQNTYSLLDAAALVTTTQLDFSDPETAPDFTALSFYKIFGFPDLGALIVLKKSGHILSWRRYFGGGTVDMLTVYHEATVQRKNETLHEALEDGTLPFHSIVALGCAIDTHKKLYTSMASISRHTAFLGHRLYSRLSSLTHYNGRPACVIYNDVADPHPYVDASRQGATVAFNLIRANGTYVRYSLVEQLANENSIYLRSGGLCNPGGIASHLKIEPWQFKRAWSAGHKCGAADDLEVIGGKATGVVRASLGAMSTLRDVDTFIGFLSITFVENPIVLPPPNFEIHSTTATFDFEAQYRGSPQPALQSRYKTQPRVPATHEVQQKREPSFDFDTTGRVAPRPPQQPRHKTSTLSLKGPVLSPKSFFGRKSIETNRLAPPELSPRVSELSGRTMTPEDVELRELLKQKLSMKSINKSKGGLKFWKEIGGKI